MNATALYGTWGVGASVWFSPLTMSGTNHRGRQVHPPLPDPERTPAATDRREFDIAQKLQHPGLVRLLTLDRWQEIHFLVMELLDGPTLSQFIQEQVPWNGNGSSL